MKRHTSIGCLACVLSLATWLHAQAVPTASRLGSIQLGAGVTLISPDYTPLYLKGVSIYGDFDLHNIGVEGDFHYSVITPGDLSENSYLLGPRYTFHKRRFEPYGKALFGIGRLGFQQGFFPVPNSYTYFQYALGGGLDYRATRHVNVRPFDIEFQKWPELAPHGLSPIVYTFGVAYVLR